MSISPNVVHVLRLMANGEYFSGEALGQCLGVSRAAVWKQLQSVEALGVGIERKRGKGYRLLRKMTLLDRDRILMLVESHIKTAITDLVVEVELDSTNKLLMERCANADSIHGLVITAERQTAGRGRRGREWHSPFASNIYLSIGWTFQQGIAAVEGLSLAVGVAICRALMAVGMHDARLKWPNDILVDNKKLGGVLIELTGDPAGECHVVVGLGLNVSMPNVDIEKIDQPWVDLRECGLEVERNLLVASLLKQLIPLLSTYEISRFLPYRDAWESLSAHTGKVVSLCSPVKIINGLMLGVTDSGSLRLELNGEEQVFVGGEVSLRVPA